MLSAVIAAVVFFDFLFYTGFYACDDALYFRSAVSLLESGHINDTSDVGSMRLVIVGWCVLAARLLGPSVQMMAATFVMFHAALVLLTWRLAVRTYDERTGLLAAWLVGTVPLILHHATQTHTDTPLAVFMVLTVLLMTEGYRARSSRGAALLLLAAGLAAGLAYGVKESGLIILPWCFAYWLYTECSRFRGKRDESGSENAAPMPALGRLSRAVGRGALFLAGFAAVFAAERFLLGEITNGHTERLSWSASASYAGAEAKYLLDGGSSVIGRLRGFVRQLDYLHFPMSLRYLAIASLLAYPFLRLRRWAVPLAGLWITAYLIWGTVTFTQYLPPSQHPRYFIPAIPFLGIACAAVLIRLGDIVRRISFAPRLVSAGGGVAMAALILVPVLNLDAADRIAGRGSRASFVGSAAEAIRMARMAGRGKDRPVVLSGLVAAHLKPTLHARQPGEILLAEELSEGDVRRLLRDGGFYYVDDNRSDLLRRDEIPSNTIDDLMHNATLVGGEWDDCKVALASVWPQVALASAADEPMWELPAPMELQIVRLANVAVPPSRLRDLWCRYARIVPSEIQTCDSSFSVDLFRVTPAEAMRFVEAPHAFEDGLALSGE